jgi:UrcA family protein
MELRDLNLHDPDTARLLLARLDRAAWQACGGDPRFNDSYETRPGHVRRVYRECRDKAVARAVKEIGVQTLTQAYNESKSEPPKEASTRSTAPGPTLSTPGSAWEPGRRAGG